MRQILLRIFFKHTLWFFLFAFFGIMSNLSAQLKTLPKTPSVADSLYKEITKTKDEIKQLKNTRYFINAIYYTYPDSAYELLKEIFPKAIALDNQNLIADLYYAQGQIYSRRQQLDSSIIAFENGKKIALEQNDKVLLSHFMDQLGNCFHYKNDNEKGIKYLKDALALVVESKAPKDEVRVSNNLGRVYSFMHEYDSSIVYLERALDIQKKLGNKSLQAQILVNLSAPYSFQNEHEKSISLCLEAVNLMQEVNDLVGVAIIYKEIGVKYYFRGLYVKTLSYFNQALNIIEQTSNQSEKISILDYLGEAYLTIEDYENALLYWKKAAGAWEVAHNNEENPDFYFKQGQVLLLSKNYEESLANLKKSKSIRQQSGQTHNHTLLLYTGQCYDKMGQVDSAKYYYTITIDSSVNDQLIIAQSHNRLGNLFEKQGQATIALKHYEKAFKISEAKKFLDNKMEASEGLYRIYKEQNQPTKAFQFLDIVHSLRDTVFNKKNTIAIARLQAEYEFDKEKRALAVKLAKEREQERNIRWLLAGALGIASLLLLAAFAFFRNRQKANARLNELNKEILEQKNVVEKQKEKLEELDKAKSRFFTNISHEFRTPLTIISGMAEQIKAKPNVWLDKGIGMIRENANSLLYLINQILDLRQLESGALNLQLVQNDIIPYLKYIVDSYKPYAESKSLQLHFLTEASSLMMDYDPDKMLRIISNLISNAIKYNIEGGQIYFQIEKIHSTTTSTNELLQIRIKDTGIGIPEDKIPFIFDRFYQVDPDSYQDITQEQEGTGIGLALTLELIRLMEGHIDVLSEEGKGTSFTISLPIRNDAPNAGPFTPSNTKTIEPAIHDKLSFSPQLQVQHIKDTKRPNLLIVEDNLDIIQYLTACLEEAYQLQIAHNGQKGIDLAIEEIPDLIISDIMMPVKDGYDLCQTLKQDERTSHIPIILLTAKADLEAKIEGLEKGADAYLAKPFNQKELKVRIKKLLELRQELQNRFTLNILSNDKQRSQQSPEDAFLLKLNELVTQNLSKPEFGMLQLCHGLKMSRSQVFRKVKALTGKAPTSLVRSIRLHTAKKLLTNSDLNISEIAYEVGFSSPNYFSAAYYDEFGIRPSASRS